MQQYRYTIYEIFEKMETMTRAQSIDWLRRNDTIALRRVLRWIYDPTLVKLLPNAAPPWTKNDGVGYEHMLTNESRRLKLFLKDHGYDTLNTAKRENLFIAILQQIHNKDADLLCMGLTRTHPRGITEKLVLDAFPDLYQTKFL